MRYYVIEYSRPPVLKCMLLGNSVDQYLLVRQSTPVVLLTSRGVNHFCSRMTPSPSSRRRGKLGKKNNLKL
jgi:hypothetical protein